MPLRPKSAFLLRGRKYLLSKTRPPFPFPDVEFKGIKSSLAEQRASERARSTIQSKDENERQQDRISMGTQWSESKI